MVRTSLFAPAFFALSLPAVSAAAPDEVVYREPAGVDVEAEWAALPDEMAELSEEATHVLRGEILTTREDIGGPGPMTVVAVVVDDAYRGTVSPGSVVELEIPLEGPISGDRPSRPVPVRGYDVAVFLDETGALLDGGMFLIEGGFAWRPNRAGVLLSPRLQRDWEAIVDPIGDYDVFSLDDLEAAGRARRGPSASQRRSRRRR